MSSSTGSTDSSSSSSSSGSVMISGQSMTVSSIERKICDEIRKAESELKRELPLLKHQDLLGMALFLASLGAMAASWGFYYYNNYFISTGNGSLSYASSTAICIAIIAFSTSVLHELEHDLIHNLYFKSSRLTQDVMFFCIWVAKMHGNPWFRRELHLKHHIVSGQTNDAEERLIGLGLPFGWKRLAVTMHPVGSTLVTMDVAKDCEFLNVRRMNLTSAPVVTVFILLVKLVTVYLALQFLSTYYHVPYAESLLVRYSTFWKIVWDLNMLAVVPNVLRQSSIQLMSNLSHYYGDIPEKSAYYQNQILDHWMFVPFQLLCFNFGATHIIHHYVPGQAFYVRSLVFYKVKQMMVDHGVRCNDLGVVLRGNRYFKNPSEAAQHGILRKVELPTTIASSILKLFPESFSMSVWCLSFVTIGYPSFFVFDTLSSVYLNIDLYKRYTARWRMKTA